eukprot:jgi/Mesvir1/13235/Mv01355-RA.1
MTRLSLLHPVGIGLKMPWPSHYYPCLNRSRCCQKAICTECYLQVRVPASSSSSRAPPCPFCKVGHYSVVFHGAKSTEEKMREEAVSGEVEGVEGMGGIEGSGLGM